MKNLRVEPADLWIIHDSNANYNEVPYYPVSGTDVLIIWIYASSHLTPGGPLARSYILIGNCSRWLTQAFSLETSIRKLAAW